MNRNIVLAVLGGVATTLMIAIFFISPQETNYSFDDASTASSSSVSSTTISIKHIKNSSYTKTRHSKYFPQKKEVTQKNRKNLDPKIKAQTIDHSGTYLLEIIDNSQENKDVKPVYAPEKYYPISGQINGNFYFLQVPKNLVLTEQTKIKITNLKTKKVIEKNADFLSEAMGYDEKNIPKININTRQQSDVIFNLKPQKVFTGENSAVPHL